MIYLLDRNQIIFHLVNKSEIHPALSEIAKFISLSIYMTYIFILTTMTFREGGTFQIKYFDVLVSSP